LGVATDSVGCPLDSDDDGIYDYLDGEPNSRKGAYVNSEGVEITEEDVIAMLNKSMAVGRNEVDLYIRKADSYARKGSGIPIPEKFKPLDTDNDAYISFDEMLREIDRYFDFQSKLSAPDIYELNNFFFAQ
jgi:Ca2+-binding EF-hand superfamily protein